VSEPAEHFNLRGRFSAGRWQRLRLLERSGVAARRGRSGEEKGEGFERRGTVSNLPCSGESAKQAAFMKIISGVGIALAVWMLALVPFAKADDGEVGVLFLKNNGPNIGWVWVNGVYQGYVSPGQARYTVKEGFVTRDSGYQADGTLKQTYAQGGWDGNGPVKVLIKSVDDTGNLYVTSIEVTGDDSKNGHVWFGQTNAGGEPASWEDASQINLGQALASVDPTRARKLAARTNTNPFVGVWRSGDSGESWIYQFTPKGIFRYWWKRGSRGSEVEGTYVVIGSVARLKGKFTQYTGVGRIQVGDPSNVDQDINELRRTFTKDK